MKMLDLGGTGLMCSNVALGCYRLRDDDAKAARQLVEAALECGVNFFDHADIYGKGESEIAFGNAFRATGADRESVFVQTKCGIDKVNMIYDFSKEHILEAVDGSLERLGMDYVDVLLLHRPDALMEPEEVGEAFDILQVSGKVRHFGVSNFSAAQVELLQRGIGQKLIANQLQFGVGHTLMLEESLYLNTVFPGAVNRTGGILDYCRVNDITIQAWSPLQHGWFAGPVTDSPDYVELNAVMDELAQKYGVSKEALPVLWIARHPANIQTVVGTTQADRLRRICQTGDTRLTRVEWYAMYRAAGNRLL